MSGSSDKRPSVLIVDDVSKNIQVIANILKEKGYRMTFAQSGDAALSHLKARMFDLILLDVMMPGMDGFDLCKILKNDSRTRDIPVIFLTAKTDTESIVAGFSLGAADYITKPFNAAELQARVETHLALRLAREELEELNAAKDKFFSIIAHEMKAPFNTLIGGFHLLKGNRLSEEQKQDMLRMMDMASQNALGLLENLLKWARSQIGHLKSQPQMTDLHYIAQFTVLLLTETASGKNIGISNRIGKNTLAFADMDMITTVIRNLVGNAIKYTNSGGSIAIEAHDNGDIWEISVSDTGIGMKPEDIAKLFRIDVKHSTPGTAEEQGTGLGLNLCKEFVEKNGGEIRVESEVGKGSRFCFTLSKYVSPQEDIHGNG